MASSSTQKKNTLLANGWTHDSKWWYYKGVGQGYPLATAWKLCKALKKPPQQSDAKLAEAREAVIRAAKALGQPKEGTMSATIRAIKESATGRRAAQKAGGQVSKSTQDEWADGIRELARRDELIKQAERAVVDAAEAWADATQRKLYPALTAQERKLMRAIKKLRRASE